jgi:hypothetical protein
MRFWQSLLGCYVQNGMVVILLSLLDLLVIVCPLLE